MRRRRDARRRGAFVEYCFADPFPHLVVDDFLPEPVAASPSRTFRASTLKSDRVFDMGYAGLHKRQVLPDW